MKKPQFASQLGLGCFLAFGIVSPLAAEKAPPESHPILAHRGVHQTYAREGLERDTCTASRINPPTHAFIENTIPSLLATVALGADVIEVDVHPTTDGDFAVFHDWTLDCRTNGSGVTRTHTMAYLRGLDVGYGYTADQGASFPLRGKGLGLLVNLEEVLDALPSTQVLINIKSRDPEEGRKLAAYLAKRGVSPDRVVVYGHEVPVATYLQAAGPAYRGFSKKQVADCLKSFVLWGWSGFVPKACKRSVILVPHSHTGFIWGWQSSFAKRMAKAGSQVYLVGPVPKNSQSSLAGLNDPALLKGLPEGVGVWTDAVEIIAPALAGK